MSDKATYCRKRGLNPGRSKRIFSKTSRPALGVTQFPVQWVSGFISGVRQSGGEFDPCSCWKVLVEFTYSLLHLRGLDGDRILFTYRFNKGGSFITVKGWELHANNSYLILMSIQHIRFTFILFYISMLWWSGTNEKLILPSLLKVRGNSDGY